MKNNPQKTICFLGTRDSLSTVTRYIAGSGFRTIHITALGHMTALGDAEEARIRNFEIDCVLIDTGEGAIDNGSERVRKIREYRPVPVVLLIDSSMDGPPREYAALAHSGCIDRNANPASLVSALASAIELAEARETLQRRQDLYDALFNTETAACQLFRSERDETGAIVDFVYVDVNRKIEEALGMTRSELIGRRMNEIRPYYKEDSFFESFVEVVETGEPLIEDFFLPETDMPEGWHYHEVQRVGDGIMIRHVQMNEAKELERMLIQALREEVARTKDLEQSLETMKILMDEGSSFPEIRH